MIRKKDLLKYINDLPEQFSIDELLDRILLVHKVETGLEQSGKDQVVTHEEVKKKLKKFQ